MDDSLSSVISKARVSRIETFSGDHPTRDIIRAQQFASRRPEHAKAEPRKFIPGEVAIAAIGSLRSDRLRVEIGREHAKHTVNVREVGPILVKLALHLIDDAGQLAPLLDKPERT